MKKSLGIKPYTDFWMNCHFNMYFSILTSIDPSYRWAAYLNDYCFTIKDEQTPLNTTYKNLTIQSMVNFHHQFLSNLVSARKPIQFKEKKNYMSYLKKLIRNKQHILVGVDLFYWIPKSISWNKQHWQHYSLLNGYDDEKKVFYVLDDDRNGFNEHAIPEERFDIAVQNAALYPHGWIERIPKKIPAYTFSMNDVKENAIRLVENIEALQFDTIWMLSEEDYDRGYVCDSISVYVYQIMNRQKATQVLFQMLLERSELKLETYRFLEQYPKELYRRWTLVRGKMVKTYHCKDKIAQVMEVNTICRSLLEKEREMWECLVDRI